MAWRLATSLEQLQAELDARFPNRVRPDWTIGDTDHQNRKSDHNPNSNGVVCAIDVRGEAVARWLWEHLLDTRDGRIKYNIFDWDIVSSRVSPWVVRSYTGSNGHADHIHVSVGPEQWKYDDESGWGVANPPTNLVPDPTPIRRTTMDTPMPVLKAGHEGGDVTSLQTLLNAKAGQGVAVNGIFDPETEGGVINVQRFFDLDLIDGVVGSETWPAFFL